jgi:uncharacterized small protein (DUF1192 family)
MSHPFSIDEINARYAALIDATDDPAEIDRLDAERVELIANHPES